MLEWLAEILPPLIGTVLLWSACIKLFTRRGKFNATSTALAKLVGTERASFAHRTVGSCEAVLAIFLFAPPLWKVEAVAVIVLGAGFLAYLIYGRIAAPDASCGCMGSKHTPVSWRSFARAGWVVATGGISLFANSSWINPVLDDPGPAILMLAALAALFVVLSPEFDRYWLVPLRRLRVRLTHPLGADSQEVPLDHSVEQLRRSHTYTAVASMLRTGVRESWDDEDGWRFVVYGASHDGQDASAVFAVPLHYYDPGEVKVAVVNESTAETLFRLDPAQAPLPDLT